MMDQTIVGRRHVESCVKDRAALAPDWRAIFAAIGKRIRSLPLGRRLASKA